MGAKAPSAPGFDRTRTVGAGEAPGLSAGPRRRAGGPSGRAFLLAVVILGGALALPGCGGDDPQPTSGGGAPAGVATSGGERSAGETSAGGAASGGGSSSGGGSAAGAPSAAASGLPPATENPSFRGDDGAERFADFAASVCRTVAQGVPPSPEPNARATEVRSYDVALAAAADRVTAALERLAGQRPQSADDLKPVITRAVAVRDLARAGAATRKAATRNREALKAPVAAFEAEATKAELRGCRL